MTETDEDQQEKEQEGREPEREAPVALSTYHTDAHLTAQEAANKKDAHDAESRNEDSGEGE